MAAPFTSNNGSTFYNINQCRSVTQAISTNLIQLSAIPCSEAVFVSSFNSAGLKSSFHLPCSPCLTLYQANKYIKKT